MSALLTLRQAAPLVGCRDPRTARKRLAALGVQAVELGGSVMVDRGDVERAVRAALRPLDAAAPRAGGVILAPGARLWDGADEVGPRRVNGRPRGSRALDAPGRTGSLRTPRASDATSSSTTRPDEGGTT